MSGGEYEYLYIQDAHTLMLKTHIIQAMADRLAELGYASDAARETQELLLTVRQYENRIDVMQARLAGVWKAVEWCDSGDWGEDEIKRALGKYRGDEHE